MTTDQDAFEQIVLFDVQGLWGGRDLWISADGKAICRVVKHPGGSATGLHEARYTCSVPSNELTSLAQKIADNDFFQLKTPDRYGVPDEARPVVFVKSASRSRAVAKWANDAHPAFDAIYAALMRIVRLAEKGAPAKECPYDRDWTPPGFPDNTALDDLAKPSLESI